MPLNYLVNCCAPSPVQYRWSAQNENAVNSRFFASLERFKYLTQCLWGLLSLWKRNLVHPASCTAFCVKVAMERCKMKKRKFEVEPDGSDAIWFIKGVLQPTRREGEAESPPWPKYFQACLDHTVWNLIRTVGFLYHVSQGIVWWAQQDSYPISCKRHINSDNWEPPGKTGLYWLSKTLQDRLIGDLTMHSPME